MKKLLIKPLWIALACLFLALFIGMLIGGSIANTYARPINDYFGLDNFRTETIGETENIDSEYYKSNYVQYNEDGSIKYTTDEETGYTHQLYDDQALLDHGIETARQVQKEGTTILWNNAEGSSVKGLPLVPGNKISLFSHSSVAWVNSGTGSGNAIILWTNEFKDRLEEAGLAVNPSLWSFYSVGDGRNYTRVNGEDPNEVPWSRYSDDVRNSFGNYGDAAVITLSRVSGERMAGYEINDVLRPGSIEGRNAKTISGDYFGLSQEEKDMIENVIELKKAGTFKKVIILLNTAVGMNFKELMPYRNDPNGVDACVWTGQTGTHGLYAVADILAGKAVPSGHLPDTFVYDGKSAPAEVNGSSGNYTNASSMRFQNETYQNYYIVYAENIYVGYKYYETRYEDAVMGEGNAGSRKGAVNSSLGWKYDEEVAFPFGYGSAYTEFEYSNFSAVSDEDGNYTVSVTVTNTGETVGADAVQVYLQKPYTDYDREHGIEQAAVNLCGMAKTVELGSGESQTVTIDVEARSFATYDDTVQKTFIREGGDDNVYYLAVGQDAHDAVNNILAKKGYTPSNTNNVMDAEGNAGLVQDIVFAEDDYETFASAPVTGNEITNRFEDVDWNKYEHKGPEEITYLSRRDWDATYPTAKASLSLTQEMVDDLAYQRSVEQDPEDEMPVYGQDSGLLLIDLRGLEFDDPAWDALLDQLTLEEQVDFIGNCYLGTPGIQSIVAPDTGLGEGPLGLIRQYKTNLPGTYAVAFPMTPIRAGTFNVELQYEVGRIIGEDCLHAGEMGLNCPAINIHRMQYGGRAYEYYSEDGYLSGVMAGRQTAGIQEAGAVVGLKHFVLNDQEVSRWNGIAVWAKEQSIREIYLEAFRPSVEEAKAKSVMTSFTRIGTQWCGAHDGLLEGVLRGEWGFEGYVISDCPWFEFMGVVDGLMAGNDCILYSLSDAQKQQYYDQADNPTVAQAIRTSTHRVLYVIANSCAMNGFTSNTRIIPITNWWQHLILALQILFGILAVACITMTVLSFVLVRKKKQTPERT